MSSNEYRTFPRPRGETGTCPYQRVIRDSPRTGLTRSGAARQRGADYNSFSSFSKSSSVISRISGA